MVDAHTIDMHDVTVDQTFAKPVPAVQASQLPEQQAAISEQAVTLSQTFDSAALSANAPTQQADRNLDNNRIHTPDNASMRTIVTNSPDVCNAADGASTNFDSAGVEMQIREQQAGGMFGELFTATCSNFKQAFEDVKVALDVDAAPQQPQHAFVPEQPQPVVAYNHTPTAGLG